MYIRIANFKCIIMYNSQFQVLHDQTLLSKGYIESYVTAAMHILITKVHKKMAVTDSTISGPLLLLELKDINFNTVI